MMPPASVAGKSQGVAKLMRKVIGSPATLTGSAIILLLFSIAILAPLIAPFGANENTGEMLASPSWAHPFGTNIQGRDILSRIILGSRNSLGVAIPAVLLSLVIGIPVGLLSGFIGGFFDIITNRLFDIIFAFPTILFAIVLVAYVGASIENLVVIIAFLFAPRVAVVVRAPTLVVKEKEFVLAGRMFGAKTLWLLRKHVLPNIVGPILIEASLLFSTALLTEASLSFLGLGVQPPNPSWGADLGKGREFMELGVFQVLFPGLTIMLAVLGFNLLSDGLRDLLDPKNRK